jgi:glycosyltransferase EpsH
MSDCLVSVVVPIYKVEKYLERCLDSITAQHYRPIEVILVNDGSPDGCAEIIRRYEARYPFIQSILQQNSGPGIARNAGIARAKGQYLALVDADDYLEPDYLGRLVGLAERNQADIAVCGFYFNLPNGLKIPAPPLTFQKNISGEQAARMSLNYLKISIFVWNKLYRRSLFSEQAFSFPGEPYEDVATACRILLLARRVSITSRPYYHYCWNRTGISGTFGVQSLAGYLQSVDAVRHFIWSGRRWHAWQADYRRFLHNVEMVLFFQIALQRNAIPRQNRGPLVRQMHRQLRALAKEPDPV